MSPIAEAGMNDDAAHQVDDRNHPKITIGSGAVRIHVFEFICGGGLADAPLPGALAHEGDLMLTALLNELIDLPQLDVSYARDARLAPLAGPHLERARVCWRRSEEAPQHALARELAAADAFWPIAPETSGALEAAARAAVEAGCRLLGPRPEAIALAASKFATAQRLLQAGVAAAPAFRAGSRLDDVPGPWVLKPDDGAGCVGLHLTAGRAAAQARLDAAGPGWIAQPWIDGDAKSLCVLADHNRVDVLSVNRQHLINRGDSIELAAIDVNLEPVTPQLQVLAERTARAIPGLCGYFGIDFLQTAGGPVVIEVNPRLTSSYAALGRALGLNIAQRVLAPGMPGTTGSLAPVRHRDSSAVHLSLQAARHDGF